MRVNFSGGGGGGRASAYECARSSYRRTLPLDGALNGRRRAVVDGGLRGREERVLEELAGCEEFLAQRVEVLLLEVHEARQLRCALALHLHRLIRLLHLRARQTRTRVPAKETLRVIGRHS